MTRRPVPLAVGGLAVLAVLVLLAFNATGLVSTATTYRADFTEAAGLQAGDMVTIAGVEAGRVGAVALDGDHVSVTFAVDDAWVGDQTSASIQIRTLLGEHRFPGRGSLALAELLADLDGSGYSGPVTLEVGPVAVRAWWPPAVRRRLAQAVVWMRRATGHA